MRKTWPPMSVGANLSGIEKVRRLTSAATLFCEADSVFYFVVRRLRWLARVPGLPQLFDALLLMGTCVFRRSRLAAMETLEVKALRLAGIRLKVHRFGGIEFVEQGGRELGHL